MGAAENLKEDESGKKVDYVKNLFNRAFEKLPASDRNYLQRSQVRWHDGGRTWWKGFQHMLLKKADHFERLSDYTIFVEIKEQFEKNIVEGPEGEQLEKIQDKLFGKMEKYRKETPSQKNAKNKAAGAGNLYSIERVGFTWDNIKRQLGLMGKEEFMEKYKHLADAQEKHVANDNAEVDADQTEAKKTVDEHRSKTADKVHAIAPEDDASKPV